MNVQQDPYGNWLARYVFPELVNELKIEVDVVADMTVYNPFDFFVEESAEIWPFEYGEDLRPDLVIYRTPEPAGPRLQAFLDGIDRSPKRTVDFVVDLNRRVAREIQYVIRMEPGVQSPEETFERGLGLVPRFELAPGADPAPSGLCGAIRLRLSGPAQARPRLARRAARHGPRLHRSPRVGRGLSSRRGLDRPRSDLRAARRRKPHSRSPRRRIIATPRRSRGWRVSPMSTSPSTCG